MSALLDAIWRAKSGSREIVAKKQHLQSFGIAFDPHLSTYGGRVLRPFESGTRQSAISVA